MNVLITGCAGFIGFWLAKKALEHGHKVVGIDNLNDYYDVSLKEARIEQLKELDGGFTFVKGDITDKQALEGLFGNGFDVVVNLAAQAGVRYSLTNPDAYIQANIVGFTNILECCRHHQVGHLVYASSSSVYGANTKLPFCVEDNVDHPVSLYAATKKANELMAHTYAYLYQLPVTGLRFFTVYGPWGRPDMALFKFVKAIYEDKPLDLYNQGEMIRDFTYVEDIVEGVYRIMQKPAPRDEQWDGQRPNPATSYAPYRLYNIGRSKAEHLKDFVKAIEKATQKKAIINPMPMQPGDVKATSADVSALAEDFGYRPSTSIEEGIEQFVKWYQYYYLK